MMTNITTHKRFCHSCGGNVSVYDQYCDECGEKLEFNVEPQTQIPENPTIISPQPYVYIPHQPQQQPAYGQRPLTPAEEIKDGIKRFVDNFKESVKIHTENFRKQVYDKRDEIKQMNETFKENWQRKKKLKKPKKPFHRAEYIVLPILTLLFWIGYLVSVEAGEINNSNFGPALIAWLNTTVMFILYGQLMDLARGYAGMKHYNVQSTMIMVKAIWGGVYIAYGLPGFTEAWKAAPMMDKIPTTERLELFEFLEVVPTIAMTIIGILFIVSLYQASAYKQKYKKYKKKLKKYKIALKEYKQGPKVQNIPTVNDNSYIYRR